MATAKQKAAARRNIKKAQAALQAKFAGVVGGVRTKARAAGGKAKAAVKRQGIGGLLRKGKWIVTLLGTAIYSVIRYGGGNFTRDRILQAYFGLQVETDGKLRFNAQQAIPQWSGFVTAGAHDWVNRKTGHYRRLSKKHLLPLISEGYVLLDSLACSGARGGPRPGPVAILPQNVDFVQALACYEDSISGFDPDSMTYDFNRRFRTQAVANLAADAGSYIFAKMGWNRFLPKGLNA